jgi:ElaA protein
MIHAAGFDQLDPRTLYRILRLRSEVFVVEQACVYLDLDGRDMEPATIHVWADPVEEAPTVAAALRLLADADGAWRIGRVVTAAEERGLGLAGVLIERALTLVPASAPVVLDAQLRLEGWYRGWGFERTGPDFDEDGIVHVPMRRPARVGAGP